jgi:hypothetical protein
MELINNKGSKTMTLEDLKFQIEDMVRTHGEAILKKPVFASCDYGDYCHTQQLVPLDNPRVALSYETAYSTSRLAVRDEDHEDCEDFDDSEYESNKNAVVVF